MLLDEPSLLPLHPSCIYINDLLFTFLIHNKDIYSIKLLKLSEVLFSLSQTLFFLLYSSHLSFDVVVYAQAWVTSRLHDSHLKMSTR